MKKFLSIYGLGLFLSAVIISSLFLPEFWEKLLVVALVVISQTILESFDRYSFLKWDEYPGTLNGTKDFLRNISSSFVRVLSAGFIIAYSYGFTDRLNLVVDLVIIVAVVVSFFWYYGKNLFSDQKTPVIGFDISYEEIERIKRFITITLIWCSYLVAYLNFGTGYVWLSAFLAIILIIGSLVLDLMFEVQLEETKTKKRVIIVSSLAPFLICSISTIYQFWTNIWDFVGASWIWIINNSKPACDAIAEVLTFRFYLGDTSLSVWLILIIIFVVIIGIKIFKDYFNYLQSNRKAILERAKYDEEKARAHELLMQEQEKRNQNLINIIYSLANDNPITKDQLVYLAKNQDFITGFPIKKLTKFSFEQMFSISGLKGKIIWEHDLENILEMYNSFFKKTETSDEDLISIINSVKNLCKFVERFKDYQSFDVFKKMLDKIAYSIPSQWQK